MSTSSLVKVCGDDLVMEDVVLLVRGAGIHEFVREGLEDGDGRLLAAFAVAARLARADVGEGRQVALCPRAPAQPAQADWYR